MRGPGSCSEAMRKRRQRATRRRVATAQREVRTRREHAGDPEPARDAAAAVASDVRQRRCALAADDRGRLARLARFADLGDQVEATRRIFASDTRWTVVRGSKLQEGVSEGLPVWSRHVGDPILQSDITRRVDFALFMVHALENDDLVHEAPAIVSRQSPSALAHGSAPASLERT